MIVGDLVHPNQTETSIEVTSRAKRVVDALTYLQPTAGTIEQFSPENLLSVHGRSGSAEHLVVMSQQPVAVPTAPMPALVGSFKDAAYRLAIISAEPLATPTPASFEVHCLRPSAYPFVELLRRQYHPRVEPEQQETRAYGTFVELADWLGMTQEETARVLGMGRTTPLAWRRQGHEPQPARARRLYQTHALVNTLLRRLGREEMRRWMETGDPSPLDLIAEGDVTAADDLAEELIFGTAPSRERLSAWVDEPADTDVAPTRPEQAQPRRVRRRPPRRRT